MYGIQQKPREERAIRFSNLFRVKLVYSQKKMEKEIKGTNKTPLQFFLIFFSWLKTNLGEETVRSHTREEIFM